MAPVKEYSDGRTVLEPRVLAAPFEVSRKALAQMDSSVKNLKKARSRSPSTLPSSATRKEDAQCSLSAWAFPRWSCA